MLCLRCQSVHEDLNPDRSAPCCTLYSISMIPNQPWKCLGFFPSNCSLTLDGCLSYRPITPTTYFPDARTTWSSCSPNPRVWLSSGSTENNVSSPGFPGKKKKEKIQVAPEATLSHHPLLFTLPSLETSNPLSVHLLPLLIPVTGRPCGLFSVTSGPKTDIQEHH